MVVVSHQIEYHRPIAYDALPVTIELGVSELRASRLQLSYTVRQGELAAVARTVLCAFDFDLQRPIRLLPGYREFFSGHMVDAAPFRVIEAPELAGRGLPVPLPVRWSDLDAYGHVNNAMVYDFVQQARVAATTTWDPTMARAGTKDSDRLWLVVRQDVHYLSQIPHRVEPFTALVAPVKLGSSSMTLATEIMDQGSGLVFARATTVLVSADLTGRPVDLGDTTRARLASHLAP
ncbi:thioesterase [Tessaracoccus sp. HDW20]|nr:thioesterase [Tessaracoccus coleopterorum]